MNFMSCKTLQKFYRRTYTFWSLYNVSLKFQSSFMDTWYIEVFWYSLGTCISSFFSTGSHQDDSIGLQPVPDPKRAPGDIHLGVPQRPRSARTSLRALAGVLGVSPRSPHRDRPIVLRVSDLHSELRAN